MMSKPGTNEAIVNATAGTKCNQSFIFSLYVLSNRLFENKNKSGPIAAIEIIPIDANRIMLPGSSIPNTDLPTRSEIMISSAASSRFESRWFMPISTIDQNKP